MKRMIGVIAAATLAMSLFALGGTAGAASGAKVWVLHGVPGATVDVCVNGAEVASRFNYGNRFSADLPAGDYKLKVRAAQSGECTGDVIMKTVATLEDGKNYTVAAGLTGKGTPKLFAFANKISKLDKGEARVQVRHIAAAPKVDVWVNGAPAITKFAPGAEATVVLPVDDYTVKVAPAGTTTVVIGPRTFSLESGTAYQIFAAGTGDAGYRFLVLAQPVRG